MLRQRLRAQRTDLIILGAVAVFSVLFAGWALKLWRGSLEMPLRYEPIDDTKFYLMLIKDTLSHGWYQTNPELGAPFGQQLYDFPQGVDNLNFGLLKLLGAVSSNVALVGNLFFLLTFALTATSCYVAMRLLGIARGPVAVSSILFALLPYHFYRGESQLFLSAYYSIPLTGYLFLSILTRRQLFRRSQYRRPILRHLSPLTLGTVACCLIIGSDNLYYATFALLLVLAATTLAAIAHRSKGSLVAGGVVIAIIALTMGANLAPSLIYQLEHGRNAAISRTLLESEERGLRVTTLVLPVVEHRLAALSHVTTQYAGKLSSGLYEQYFETLGTFGDVGFVWIVGSVMVGALGGIAARGRQQRLQAVAGAGALTTIVIASVGGLSGLIAFLITPTLRGWSRMSLFVAFFSLLGFSLLIQQASLRIVPRAGKAAAVAAVVIVTILGVWDETSNYFVPPYSGLAREWRSDAEFGASIERTLPRGAEVFQLPYVPFPEGYPPRPGWLPNSEIGTSYELVRGYLHSSGLRWSFGAMKGRASDWSSQLAGKPLSIVMPAIAASGFAGLWVDSRGYPAGIRGSVYATLARTIGVPPAVSSDRELWFFDLRAYASRLRQRDGARELEAVRQATLYPIRVGCSAPGELRVVNAGPRAERATVTALLDSSQGQTPVRVRINYPDGTIQDLVLRRESTTVLRHLLLPAGQVTIRFSILSGSPGGSVQVLQPAVTAAAYDPLVAAARKAVGPIAGVVDRGCYL